MAIKKNQYNTNTIYFITFTCWRWLNLFEETTFYDSIYEWFDYLKKNKNCKILAYVIMPNHIHLMIYIPNANELINKIIGNGKRFLAYKMIRVLKENNRRDLLKILEKAPNRLERDRGKKHRVFTPNSDIKECYTERFILQKLNYIHNNPIKGKWKLAKDIISYSHSSASFYEGDHSSLYTVFDYRDLTF